MTDFTIAKENVADGVLLRIRCDRPLKIVELVFSESELVSCGGKIQSTVHGVYRISNLSDLNLEHLPIQSRKSVQDLIANSLTTSEDVEFVKTELESRKYYVYVNGNLIDLIIKGNHLPDAGDALYRILTDGLNQSARQADLISNQLLEGKTSEYRSSSRIW